MAILIEQSLNHVDSIRLKDKKAKRDITKMWVNLGYSLVQPPSPSCDCSDPNITLECMTYCEQNEGGSGGGGSTVTYVTKGPLLSTEWGQSSIFNDDCPILGCSVPSDGRAWVGCVAIAMGQVMRYYEIPSRYNWGIMPNTNNNGVLPNPEIAEFLSDCGEWLDMDYGCDGSTAFTQDIKGVLKDNGYQNGISYESFDVSKVTNEIRDNHPVIVDGCQNFYWVLSNPFWKVYSNCHTWVCDGYKKVISSDGNSTQTSYSELHMNWGWGIHSSAWTANFKFGIDDYKYNNKMLVNVRPN